MKKILAITEFTQLATGYAVYWRELLTQLHSRGYEIIELACACKEGDARIAAVPWTVIPNTPHESNTRAVDAFNKSPGAEFGSWQFENVVLKYKPDVVCLCRDIWHDEFVLRSPFRDFYSVVLMPAVDAVPQHKSWLNIYSKADAVLCYTDWGLQVMADSGYGIKTIGSAPPFAPKEFHRIPNKQELKKQVGISDIRIVGMVGRNQRRKLFPNLFNCFSEFLKRSQKKNVFLYCHTSFPEKAWEIDEEITNLGISNKVLFTYICRECRYIEPSLFRGPFSYCPVCKLVNSMVLSNSQHAFLNNNEMNKIYNLFDLYVQWATNEGYGIPPMEAAACGVHNVCVDYSAMSEVCDLTGGEKVKPLSFHKEIETGRNFAVPNDEALVDYMVDYFDMPYQMQDRLGILAANKYRENWDFSKTVDTWVKAINSVSAKKPWNSPQRNHTIPEVMIDGVDNPSFAKWLIVAVLGQPELLGTEFELRLITDLNNRITVGGYGGEYYHEMNSISCPRCSSVDKYENFSRELAFAVFQTMAYKRNEWDRIRCQ